MPASPITGPMLPSAFGNSDASNIARINPIVCGITNAAAAPWSALAVISTDGFGASAQQADASRNPMIPIRNTRCRPAMSPSRPPVISSTANGNVYAALNHWISDSRPPSSAWITGAATCTIVASSRFIASATSNTPNANHRHLYAAC